MQLNPDCVRDILFVVEEETTLSKQWNYPVSSAIPSRLSAYTKDEVLYHVKQCELSGFFYKVQWLSVDQGCRVHHLTPDGHAFLSNIQRDDNWAKTKDLARKVGSFSLDVLKEIAVSVISSAIK